MPTTEGISRAISKEIDGGINQGATKGEKTFGGKVGGMVKLVGGAALAVGGVVAGLALKGGFTRALNIEDAQAKLKGLGHDAETVEAIMADALASVKGTAFGLDTAATVAASAVAAGIKPGQELEKYLRLTADAATIAGSSMEEMGSIINKTTASGKVYTETLNQLADRGIPIFQWLAEEYGVTTDELSKMVSQGKVDAETFRRVIEENIGGAALASGDTTRGAFANLGASLSRVAANLLSGVFPYLKDGIVGITDVLGPIEEGAKGVGQAFGEWVGEALELWGGSFRETGLPELLQQLSPVALAFKGLQPVLPELADALAIIGDTLGNSIAKVLPTLNETLPIVVEWFTALLTRFIELSAPVAELVGGLLELSASIIDLTLNVFSPYNESLDSTTSKTRSLKENTDAVIEALNGLIDIVSSLTVGFTFASDSWTLTQDFLNGKISADEFKHSLDAMDKPFANLFDNFMASGRAMGEWVGKAITSAINFRNGFVSAISSVRAAVINLPTTIRNLFSSAGSWLYNAGVNIIQGLINGVRTMAQRAVNAVLNIGSDMVAGVKSFLGIQSPSRVFRYEVGQMIGEGLALGIGDYAPTVHASINSLIDVPAVTTGGTGSIPDSITLLDADGSILTRAAVIADGRIATKDSSAAQFVNAGTRKLG